MTAPFLGMGMPANDGWVADKFRELQRQITELRAAQTLNAATVGTGGISSSNFDGTLNPPAVGTAGWGLAGGPSGTAIFGDILLRGNIIGNDALTNPIAAAVANGFAGSLTFATSLTTYVTDSIAVPDGFSQALVMAVATAELSATGAGTCGLTVQAQIAGTNGGATVTLCQPSGFISGSAPFAQVVTGLPDDGTGTVAVACRASASSTVSAGSCNAWVSATVLFLR